MSFKKIQRLEKLKPDILERKIKRFLERNNNKKTRKSMLVKVKTRKRISRLLLIRSSTQAIIRTCKVVGSYWLGKPK